MAKAVTIEINENEAKNFEDLIDKVLAALRRLEEESPARDARLAQKQERTAKLMSEIENRLKEIAVLSANRKSFTTDLSWE